MKSSKYEPISEELKKIKKAGSLRITFSFQQIEDMLGQSLPMSARKYRPWWANNYSQKSRHCQAWLSQNWETESIDFHQERVTFVCIQ